MNLLSILLVVLAFITPESGKLKARKQVYVNQINNANFAEKDYSHTIDNPCAFFTHSENELPFLNENKLAYVFNNGNTTLIIDKQTWKTKLLGVDGKVRYSEYQKPSFYINGQWLTPQNGAIIKTVSEDGAQLSIPAPNGISINLTVEKAGDYGFKLNYRVLEAKVSRIKGKVKLQPVEEIYGFGETWNGQLAQRGQAFEIWDKTGTPDECAWMPYYVSTNNYTFSLNYGGLVKFDVGQSKSDELVFELAANELEYTIIAGDDLASSVRHFLALTGMPAKPPRWSFKPWFWLMSDPDQPQASVETLRAEHFLEIVQRLKAINIPVGVTWFEPPWQTARTTFIPNPEFSNDLKEVIKQLSNLGVNTLAWTVPYTTSEASNWDEAVKKGYLVRKPGDEPSDGKIEISRSGELKGSFYNAVDFFNPEASKWWQSQIEKAIDLGLKGFKLDAGQDIPPDGVLYGGRSGKDVHNSYALEYNRVFFETLKKKLGDDFLMIPRAAWIGSGVYTNFKWPGDLSGSFASNGLPSSVYSTLSLAFCGIPFLSTDIGGFENRPAPEQVWIRWAQFGAMLPGMQTLNMPWWYSKEALDHYRYLAWLHTDLIPYWETLANLAHETGESICKPLVWDYQNDHATWRIKDEFMIGKFLLVAPIINPDESREVYFPEGIWYDFWDDSNVIEGQQKTMYPGGGQGSIYKFPLYIKEGAVIPLEVENEISGFGSKYSKGFITLAIWPEKSAENTFILNDREGKIPITTNWKSEKELSIDWEGSSKDYLLRIHLKEEPGQITANGKLLKVFDRLVLFEESKTDGCFFDQRLRKLWIKKYSDTNTENLKIEIERTHSTSLEE